MLCRSAQDYLNVHILIELIELKIKLDSMKKDMKELTIFIKNFINFTWCTIIEMPAFKVDK